MSRSGICLLMVSAVAAAVECKCDAYYKEGPDGGCNGCYFEKNYGATAFNGCLPQENITKTELLDIAGKEWEYKGKKLDSLAVKCYGQGDYKEINPGIWECECDKTQGADKPTTLDRTSHCSTCIVGYMGWPDCLDQPCSSDPCGTKGTCNDEGLNSKFCSTTDAAGNPVGNNLRDTTYVAGEMACCSGTVRIDQKDVDIKWKIDLKDRNGESNGRKCCTNNGQGYCEYDEDCVSGACIKKGYDQCEYSGEPDPTRVGNLPYPHACPPTQECCGTACCGDGQTCVESAGGGDFATLARMEWIRKNGKEVSEQERMVCTNDIMSSPSAIRAGVLPFFLIVAIVASTGLVFGAAGMGEMKVAIPALLVIVCCVLMVISQFWSSSLLMSLGALTAIGAQSATSDYRHFVSVVIQFLFFASYLGTFNLGELLVSNRSTLFTYQLTDSGSYNWGILRTCSNWYGTFNKDGATQSWDDLERYYGLCSHGWQSMVVFLTFCIVFLYFIQMVASATLMMGK